MLTVSALNVGGVQAYTKAGFQQEEVLRQACYRDGAYHDKIVMAILRPEWENWEANQGRAWFKGVKAQETSQMA